MAKKRAPYPPKCMRKQVFLDPTCPEVAIKSAESDGVSADWADYHITHCVRCREYEGLVLYRSQQRAEMDHALRRIPPQNQQMYIKVPRHIRRVILDVER